MVMRLILAILVWIQCLSHVESFSALPYSNSHSRSTVSRVVATVAESSETHWTFNGFDVYSEVTSATTRTNKENPTVLLIHGFGCSTTYWRETTAALASAGYTVHAIDLLGQGKSSKPGRENGVEYSINLWADLVDKYAQENIAKDQNIVLIGNSLGSLVALSAATGDFSYDSSTTNLKSRVKGIGMFNCGIGLNSRGIVNEPQRGPIERLVINGLYNILVFFIFGNTPLLEYVLREVVTRDLLRDTLKNLYISRQDRVDDALVDSFYLPAKQEGAVDALSQIYVNDPGATPMDLHSRYNDLLSELPIHLVWGEDDVVTPVVGGVGQFYKRLAEEQPNISLEMIPKCGHIPFDDNDGPSNDSMLKWLDSLSY